MLSNFPNDINVVIWSLLTQTDRIALLGVDKACNRTFTSFLYKNLLLNDQKVVTMHQREIEYFGTFSEYSFLKYEENGDRFKKTYKYMQRLIETLNSKPEYLLFIENVTNSWHLDIDLKLEFLNLLLYGKVKNAVTYKAYNLKSFENNLNFQIFKKIISNKSKESVLKFKALDIPFLTRLPITEEFLEGFNFTDYFSKISTVFNNFNHGFDNVRSLTIHFNPLLMTFCNNKKLKLNYLCLNIREREFKDNLEFLNETNLISRWEDVLDVDHLKQLELVSWLPTPQTAFLRDFELVKLLRASKNLEVLKTFSFPYYSSLVDVIINECISLKELRLDFFDLTQVLTRQFIEKHSTEKKYNSLCNLESLHIELTTVSHKDPDFLIYLLKDHPQFDILRSKLPCFCEECKHTLTEILSDKVFYKPPFIEYNLETKSIKNYSALYLLFKEMMYVMPYKFNTNLFIQYGLTSFELLKKHLNSLYESELEVDDIKQIYKFMLHYYNRGFSFMFNNFPKLNYLNLNDLPVFKCSDAPGFKPCFGIDDLV
ncbi:hypothetical protein QEN19_001890 [Hanseniaspora menglaensis]